MEYKGYKIESIKNDGHFQRVAFGIYKNGKLISTAETSKEAQHEVDNIVNHPVTIEYIIVNKKNDSKSRETIKTIESDVDKKINELERKYSNDKTYYLRDIRKVYDMKTTDKLDNAIKALDSSRGHEVVTYANQALSEMGKNNSVGKYDRVVMGVRSTLGESLLPPDELKKAVKREAERLLKKYNL